MSAFPPNPAGDPGGDTPSAAPAPAGLTIVTGAGGGIGRAIVDALLATGATVVATDSDDAALGGLVGAHPAQERLHARSLDVCSAPDVDALVDEVERDLGPVEALVCAHGILRASSAVAQTDDDWQAVHDVNVGGVMRICRAVVRQMAARHRGAIVVIGSNAAAVARDGLSAYASSKAAARHYTLSLGVEVAPLGIRCNVVSPGSTDTPMLRGAWPDPTQTAGGSLEGAANRRAIAGTPEAFWPGIPLGRIAQPDWIADAVTFLLSPQARHIALHDLRVDGGATLGS